MKLRRELFFVLEKRVAVVPLIDKRRCSLLPPRGTHSGLSFRPRQFDGVKHKCDNRRIHHPWIIPRSYNGTCSEDRRGPFRIAGANAYSAHQTTV